VSWLCAAVLLTLVTELLWLHHPFTYEHSWHASDQAVMARNFLKHGVLGLRAVPLRNNLPLGAEPDTYIHWPPLAPILLSVVFRLAGQSEAAYHSWSLVLLVAFCAALYAVIRQRYGPREGWIAVFAALTLPVTVGYSHALGNTSLTLALELASLLAFMKATAGTRIHPAWAPLGCAGVVLAVSTSWFALMLPPGLLAVALWRRDRGQIRLALLYGAVAAVTGAGVIALYLSTSPELTENLWRTVQHRMNLADFGVAEFRVHTVVDQTQFVHRVTIPRTLWAALWSALSMLGLLPVIATATVLAAGWSFRRRIAHESAYMLFAGLYGPGLLWIAAMPQHVYHHNIAMQLLVPTASAALGVCGGGLLDATARVRDDDLRRVLRAVSLVILPALMLLPLLQSLDVRRDPAASSIDWIAYSHDIKHATPPEAIVMVPTTSMVPVYYSERHLIRGVTDPALIRQVDSRLPTLFPGAPSYFALPTVSVGSSRFRRLETEFPLVKETAALRLYAVRPRGDNGQ